MAVHMFRREATYYWRRRTPRALANCLNRPHLFMSLRTTNLAMARRLGIQLDSVLEDAAMLAEQPDLHLSRSQIETMLSAVVERQLAKLERVAFAAKNGSGFDVDQAKSDDKRALWTYALLDAQGAAAAVRPEDRIRMAADGLSEADVEAVQRHLIMLRNNDLDVTLGITNLDNNRLTFGISKRTHSLPKRNKSPSVHTFRGKSHEAYDW